MSNGRQIGSIVGSLIAAYFTAGTSYAAFAVAAGGAVGGAIGGALDPDKVFGPRLDDLKVQYSNYGVGIPTLYGTERFGGNVFWSTDKREVATTERSGKGGSVKSTSYAYFVNMRLLLCETPRDGSTVAIVKIFKDGKLIWDATSGIPVGSALASAESPDASFILYQGHQDQLPNPEEEAFHGGPGSVSAYRGVVSIYMREINTPSGRVPQFSFVLSNSYDDGVEKGVLSTVPKVTDENAIALVGMAQSLHISEQQSSGSYFLRQTLIGSGYATPLATINLPARGEICIPVNGTEFGSAYVARDAGDYSGTSADYFSHPKWVELIDLQTGAATHLFDYIGTDPQHVFLGAKLLAAYDPLTGAYAVAAGTDTSAGNVYALNPVVLYGGAHAVTASTPGGIITSIAMYGGVLAILNLRGGVYYVRRYSASTFDLIDEVAGPPIGAGTNADKSALRFDSNGLFAWVRIGAGASLYAVGSGWNLLSSDVETITGQKEPDRPTTFYTDGSICVIGPSDSANRSYDLIRLNAVTVVPVKAKEIIADQCERAGELRYDVSALPDSDTVQGYKIANPASARANIEPILTAFGYFPVDEDGAIKFKRYADIVSVATVAFDELGQAESGGESTDTMPLQRTQEIDLPRSVTVTYIEPTKDYQTASETEIRLVTDATEDMQVQLPVCLGSSDQAKKVSQMVLYDAWRRQNQRSTTVSRKYAFVSPGDGVTIEYPRGTFKLWLALSTNDTGALCEWSVAPGDAAIFTRTAVGATGYEGQQVAPLPAPTRAQILDIPILRDADNNAGPYVAMDSVAPVPADAELFVGDDDTSLQSRGTVSASAPLGFAETVLGSWTRNLVDETNTFTVSLGDDVFNSCTRDVLLANAGEFWAYGAPGRWEIGSSAQGDSLGGGRYILSRHLRGLFGTENNTGNHQAGDIFVLLRVAGMLRPDTGVGGIGQAKSYRAVTKGRSINSVASQTYANTGEGLQPLRPVNLRRATSTSNDITLTWDRRSRLSMNNSSGALPLGEAAEAYTVDFYSSGTFATRVGALTSTTSTLTITSAQQAAFGLTPGAAVNVRVHQVSDAVGPSTNYLQATV